MTELSYKTRIILSEDAYPKVYNFLASRITKLEMDWRGLYYRGTIYYLDDSNMNAVRISPKRFLRRRKIELTDRVEQKVLDGINNINQSGKRR
jgi:hypothetical protein